MRCPNDDTSLSISDRQGIEIDYCPECRGVWLDRHELDKLIERSAAQAAPPEASRPAPRRNDDYDDRDDRDHRDHRDHRDDRDDRRPKKSKKSSFLSEIFEMGP